MLQPDNQVLAGRCAMKSETNIQRFRLGDWLVIVAHNVVAFKRVDAGCAPAALQGLTEDIRLPYADRSCDTFDIPQDPLA